MIDDITPKSEEEIREALLEHQKQQARNKLRQQLYFISRKPKYQTIRRRAMQRVSLKALMICLIGHGAPLMEDTERPRYNPSALAL